MILSEDRQLRPRSDLRISQQVAHERLLTKPENMLAMAMGTGKTAAVLTAVRDLLDAFEVRHVLVIAPLLVAEETWPDEIEAWEHTQVLDYEVLTGSPTRRENRARRLPELSIVNIENVVWLVDFWGDQWPYDWVIIDESSKFKNPAKRTKPTKKAVDKLVNETLASLPKGMSADEVEQEVAKAMKRAKRNITRFGALCKVRRRIDRFTELTGTIAPGGLLDLWSQYYLLDRGQRLGDTYFAYRSRWFRSDYMGFKYELVPGAFDQIMERIHDITVSMRTEDYVDMPPVVYNTLKVKLPEKVMQQYRKFEKSLLWEEHDIEAVNNGVLTGKLLQLCIAGGTEVLCDRGWVPIEDVTAADRVWDGVEYVATSGAVYQGDKHVIECFGVKMTPEHKVLTEHGWKTAQEVINADASEGFNRSEVWLPYGALPRGCGPEQGLNVEVPVRLRGGSRSTEYLASGEKSREEEVLRMSQGRDASRSLGHARHDGYSTLGDLARHAFTLQECEGQGLLELRRQGDRHAGRMVQEFQRVLGGYEDRLPGRSFARPTGQQQGVQPQELSLGNNQSSGPEHTGECSHQDTLGRDDHCRSSRALGPQVSNALRQGGSLQNTAGKDASTGQVAVYDLLDCGPRSRFVVRGADGVLIVHNCNGSIYDEDRGVHEIHSLKLDALDRIIEEANGAPVLVAYSYQFDLAKLRKKYPKAEVVGEAKNLQKRWNNKEIPILLAHPQCLHPDTLVLTEHGGWRKIVEVSASDRVFDGVEFVAHRGCQLSGIRPVIEKFGLVMTPDHPILVEGVWVEAKDVPDTTEARRKARYGYAVDAPGTGRALPPVEVPEGAAIPVYDLVDCGPRHRFMVKNGQGETFIVHNSAGHGLNLQYGGCITVWYGLHWSLECYQQLNKRLHRPGQTETVFIHHIVAEGTVDERVMEVIPDKEATQDRVMDAMLYRGSSDSYDII